MGDFVQTGIVKSSTRKFTDFVDKAAYNAIVTAILANPWTCTSYEVAGVTKPAVEKTKESVSGKVVYQDSMANVRGTVSIRAPTNAGFQTVLTDVLADVPMRTAMAGVPAHDSSEDTYSTSIRCYKGELFNVLLTRSTMTISSYTDDAILSTIETWADAQPTLA